MLLVLLVESAANGEARSAQSAPSRAVERRALEADIVEIHDIERARAALVAAMPSQRRRLSELTVREALLKHGAIQRAIRVFEIDVSRIRFGVCYSPHGAMREREGATIVDADGGIRVAIGDLAFSSAAWLASTIGHEVEVHVNRQFLKGVYYPGSDDEGAVIQEVEAYDHELANADRFGLSEAEITRLRRRRATFFRRLPWETRERIERGMYTKS